MALGGLTRQSRILLAEGALPDALGSPGRVECIMPSSELREKLVLDWNNMPIGTIRDAHVDPKTKTVRSLVIQLNRDAQSKLGAHDPSMVIPIHYVFGIRRGEITLDRSFDELRRTEAPAASAPSPTFPPA
jgi:sporulation protein YlmC with PRC-barrel domain